MIKLPKKAELMHAEHRLITQHKKAQNAEADSSLLDSRLNSWQLKQISFQQQLTVLPCSTIFFHLVGEQSLPNSWRLCINKPLKD